MLFQSAEALENLHNVNAVIMDKTGTVTEGRPVVTDVKLSGVESVTCSLALSLESRSDHPLAGRHRALAFARRTRAGAFGH
ncbi:hypothetical protein [Agathobaculum butyriciproducens]|uniref:hypothetical protein n=1 Tax=Agathobaculum butyriciproducens TaxID=1628085 RepID=UPI0036D28857